MSEQPTTPDPRTSDAEGSAAVARRAYGQPTEAFPSLRGILSQMSPDQDVSTVEPPTAFTPTVDAPAAVHLDESPADGARFRHVRPGNRLASIGLILGVVPIVGAVVGAFGLIRAKSLGDGRKRSAAGIAISLAAAVALVVVVLTTHTATPTALANAVGAQTPSGSPVPSGPPSSAPTSPGPSASASGSARAAGADPGCAAFAPMEQTVAHVGTDKDLPSLKADLASIVTTLDGGAAKAKDATTKADLARLRDDYQTLYDDMNTMAEPTSDLQKGLVADSTALAHDCVG